jgi:hypothetical protein
MGEKFVDLRNIFKAWLEEGQKEMMHSFWKCGLLDGWGISKWRSRVII